jgi:Pancreatic hormone peptide
MHSAVAAALLLMMGLIAPFSCDIALPINEDVYELPNVYIGPKGEVVVRPDRPSNFISADELKVYLESLRSYYAMMGRPRSVRNHKFHSIYSSSDSIQMCIAKKLFYNLKLRIPF